MDALTLSLPHRPARLRAALAALVVLCLATAVALLPAAAASADDPAVEDRFVALLQHERWLNGLPPLQVTGDLQQVAQAHSDRMAATGSLHHNPNLANAVPGWQRVTENVGYGGSAESVHSMLMNSAGHRANILDRSVTQLGIGVTWNGSRLWVTQVFRLPLPGFVAPSATTYTPPAPKIAPVAVPAVCPSPVPSAGFADLGTHYWMAPAIDCAAATRLASGVTDRQFNPGGTVTRAQMASFVYRLLERTGRAPATAPDLFRDDNGSPHEKAINALAKLGIVSGTAAGRYEPGAPINRGQAASLLVRLHETVAGRLPAPGTPFVDIAGSVHADAIAKVLAAGITSGTSASTFSPGAAISRAHMAVFVIRELDGLRKAGALA